jgi:hypothetical protein
MSPTTRAALMEAFPQRGLGTGPLTMDSRGVRPDPVAIPVPRPRTAAVTGDHHLFAQAIARPPRESWTCLRAALGSEDAGGASPEAQWQGSAGTSGFRWQDPDKARAIQPVDGSEASEPLLGGPA